MFSTAALREATQIRVTTVKSMTKETMQWRFILHSLNLAAKIAPEKLGLSLAHKKEMNHLPIPWIHAQRGLNVLNFEGKRTLPHQRKTSWWFQPI